MNSVYDCFKSSATTWGDRGLINVLPSTAEIYGIKAGEITYNEALKQVDELAKNYQSAGYGSGMRVGFLLENRPAFFLHWLALNKLGASVVPINPDLRASELEYLIGHAEPALIVAIPARVEELQKAAYAASIELSVIGLDDNPTPPRKNAVVADMLNSAAQEAAVLYTSGTTAKPKGCVLSNTYFLRAGEWYSQVGGIAALDTKNAERMITPLPIFHMNAMAYSFMAMLYVGGSLTALDRFHPRSWWQDVAQSRATCLHYLGVMPSILMSLPEADHDAAHNVRFGFGAGVDPKLQIAFEERFNFPLCEAWAMTETGAGAVIAASTDDRLLGQACLGKPAKDVEIKLIDDNGAEVPLGGAGELLVRAHGDDPRHGFFTCYYKDEKTTDEAWADGWFHTGDIVVMREDGNVFFKDRKKNVIRRSGENIAAVEVESILMRHPAIKAAGVCAVPDSTRGDEVFACLQVDETSPKLAEEIVMWSLSQMAYYKAPGYVAFVDQLPLTPTQKIQRAELKNLALERLDNPNTVNTIALKKRQVA